MFSGMVCVVGVFCFGCVVMQLTRIDGLQHLIYLEELSLEDNQIRSLDGIESLKSLQKLDVGKNQLETVGCRYLVTPWPLPCHYLAVILSLLAQSCNWMPDYYSPP